MFIGHKKRYYDDNSDEDDDGRHRRKRRRGYGDSDDEYSEPPSPSIEGLYKYLMNKIIFFYVIFRPCINCVQWVVNFEEEKQIIFLRVFKGCIKFFCHFNLRLEVMNSINEI